MKLSEKISELQAVLDKHGDLECIYASDPEGNEFRPADHGGFAWVEKEDRLPYYLEIVCDEDMEDEIDYMKVYCIN
jgi:hypothetical protein